MDRLATMCYVSSNLESIYAQFYMGGPGLIMAPLGAQEQSIQEIINQQLLLQEQLRPLAEGGLMGEKHRDRKHGEIEKYNRDVWCLGQWRFRHLGSSKQPLARMESSHLLYDLRPFQSRSTGRSR